MEECRTTRTKVEDFLAALGDLCAETLKKKENFNLAPIGTFRPLAAKLGQARVGFAASQQLKKHLDMPDKYYRLGPLCADCHQKEREKGRRRCGACRARHYKNLNNKKKAKGG